MELRGLVRGELLRVFGRACLATVFCALFSVASRAASSGGGFFAWAAIRAASSRPVTQLEHIYLHEMSAALLSAAHRYAAVSGVPMAHDLNHLASFKPCRHLVPSLHEGLQQLRAAVTVSDDTYFEHLLILSLTVVELNRRLYKLGIEKAAVQKNFMEDVIHHDASHAKLAALEEKINTLQARVSTLFSSDTTNMLLTVSVNDPERDKQLPLYQKIVLDYQQLLADGMIGQELLAALRRQNKASLQQAAMSLLEQSAALLQHAWQHTCAERHLAFPTSRSKRLLFYFKHRALVQRIETLLAAPAHAELRARHDKLYRAAAAKLQPSHYRTSPRLFLSMLGGLVVPSFIVSRKYNKLTLPLMAGTGLSVAWGRAQALQTMRQQLHTGVCNGLNSYRDYLAFKNGTSLSRYVFSHLAATGLAMILRKIPKGIDETFMNVDAKFLAYANVFGSFASMLAIETMQTKNLNFLKDRESFYNIFALLAVDFALAYISALNLSDEMRIALISSATMVLSVIGHVISGKEINWDRIIYDTTFISTFSLYKSIYFYTGGSRALLKNFNISTKTGQTALMSGMALLSNVLGNIPYALISRHWIEKKPPPNMFSVLKDEQQVDEIARLIEAISASSKRQ